MPRMPMIAVAATPLLLMTLLLLQTPTSTWGKATSTETVDNSTEEETTSFGDMDINTVTIGIDSELILTTEDNIQAFTHLPENGTTEEPLPESVLLQLERERAEREQQQQLNETSAAVTVKSPSENLIESTTAPSTTTTTEETTTIGKETDYSKLNSLYNDMDLEMKEDNVKASIETTTYLPQFEATATPVDNLGYYINTDKYESQSLEETTNVPLEEYKFTSGPLPAGEEKYATEDPLAAETTWMQKLEEIMESTPATEVNMETTTEPEMTNRPTENTTSTTPQAIIPTTEKPMNIVQLFRMMNSDVVTTKIMPESEPQLTTTEEPKLESSTNKIAEEITEETTIAPPKQQSLLEAIVMTTIRIPVESSTTQIVEERAETTIEPPTENEIVVTSTTTSAPESTSTTLASSSTSSITEDIAETTIEPPKQQSTLMTTTESVPEITSTSEPTTSSTSTSSTSTTSSTTSTTSTTTTTSTTEAIPIVVTRAPRVERIFNSDGVEVLYGYSSVVRTNGV